MTNLEIYDLIRKAGRIVFTVYAPDGVKDLELELRNKGITDLLTELEHLFNNNDAG